jgi:hypothetical protein
MVRGSNQTLNDAGLVIKAGQQLVNGKEFVVIQETNQNLKGTR